MDIKFIEGTQVEVDLAYATDIVERVTIELLKPMSTMELFDNIANLFGETYQLKKYRFSVADRWSRWHYVA